MEREKRERGTGSMVKLEPHSLKELEDFISKAERLLGLKLTKPQAIGMMLKAAAKLPFAEVFKVVEEEAKTA